MAEITTKERVAALEAIQEIVQHDLSEIKTNHLPHIEQKLDSLRLENKQEIAGLRTWMMGAMFSALMSTVILLGNMIIGAIGG